MEYLQVPREISIDEIRNKELSWSPGMYRRVIIPTSNIKCVSELLNNERPFDRGVEPGSMWYMQNSTYYFIRTKALQAHSNLIYPKGEAIIPINYRVFKDVRLQDGDILMSKDSNIGECAIINSDYTKNHMFSSGIVRLNPTCNRWYFYSFLKHPIFKRQLQSMTARGATITHAKTLWLNCLIPFPNQEDADRVIQYISVLMRAILEKEKAIRKRSDAINNSIQNELQTNQKTDNFCFEYPRIEEIINHGRLDAAIYDKEYKSKIWLVENYKNGFVTPENDGFSVTPGPSLEIKLLRTRIDSETYKPGFYALILPTNISEYGTMNAITYLGTAKNLPLLKQGDIVFGEAGFQKGRSIVLLDEIDNCTTNAHGLYARRTDNNISKSIFFRCIFNWYRSIKMIDIMGVGGSGGHFSPEYFKYIKIPKFPDDKQSEIVKFYHNPTSPPNHTPTLNTFVEWHHEWNINLGIWELDTGMKELQRILLNIQEKIIDGQRVEVPIHVR